MLILVTLDEADLLLNSAVKKRQLRLHITRNRGKRTSEDSDPFDKTLRRNGFTLSKALATFATFSVAAAFEAPITARGFAAVGVAASATASVLPTTS